MYKFAFSNNGAAIVYVSGRRSKQNQNSQSSPLGIGNIEIASLCIMVECETCQNGCA